MANTINTQTIIRDIWKNFLDTLKNNITSVTINGKAGPDTQTVTVQKISGEFNYAEINHKEDYPIIIVHNPKIPTDQFTFGRDQITGTILLEVYATQQEATSKLQSLMHYYIEQNRNTLRRYGLYDLQVNSTDEDEFARGGLNVHVARVIFSFKHRFARSDA
jgi:hypothetical protein